MLLGRHEAAWRRSDAINARRHKPDPQRLWDGHALTGRHVMLRCLHGFGDALQLIRYAPQISKQSASLCVQAHPEMLPLLRACDGVDRLTTWGAESSEPEPFWDAQVEIMEVAEIFRAPFGTVPVALPYLHATRLAIGEETPGIQRTMRQRRTGGRWQVGISWRSSNWNPQRSLSLKPLAAAYANLPGCDWYSLQQHGREELAGSSLSITNIEAGFADLAARMAVLDCVITVDGVLAHLAGALGVLVLLLLPHAADWRWGMGETTPWYPRMRLFRQAAPDDWSVPLAGARAALAHLIVK